MLQQHLLQHARREVDDDTCDDNNLTSRQDNDSNLTSSQDNDSNLTSSQDNDLKERSLSVCHVSK